MALGYNSNHIHSSEPIDKEKRYVCSCLYAKNRG